jgi:DNA-binding response OmpR family regulator
LSDVPLVLLFTPTTRVGADFENAFRARGYGVVRASTARSLSQLADDHRIKVVVLDCSECRALERAVEVLDGARSSVPRIWVSSSSDAPARSGGLGIDALLIDPDDVAGIVASVERFLRPRRATTAPPVRFELASGTNAPRARTRGTGPVTARRSPTEDPSGSWDDPTSDWKLRS